MMFEVAGGREEMVGGEGKHHQKFSELPVDGIEATGRNTALRSAKGTSE